MQVNIEPKAASAVRRQRLIEAAIDGWCLKSSGELSARALAADAGIAASAIYYYFSDLEHLYEAAQAHALAEAQLWCTGQRRALEDIRDAGQLPVAALGPLLAAVIDDLCAGQRRIAFAWRECQLLAARQRRFVPLLAEWDAMFRALIADVCEFVGIGRDADLSYYFFEGESLFHLIGRNRLQDRACLDEITAGWADWMQGRVPLCGTWRLLAWRQARLAAPVAAGHVDDRIAKAAARLLVDHGVAGITHRAVAAEAGMTLGVVAHQCRRAAELFEQAYGAIYEELTGNRVEQGVGVRLEPTRGMPTRRQMLGVEELILAVARGRTDPAFATRLRYLRGTTTSFLVEGRLGISGEDAVLISTIFSNTMIGLLRHGTEGAREAELLSAEARLFDRLSRREG